MNEAELLAKRVPSDLFPNDADEAKSIYHKLARMFHPDANFGRDAAFKHLAELHKLAQEQISKGIWKSDSEIQLKLKDGKSIKWSFISEHQFELGTLFVCNEHAIYVIDKKHKALVDRAIGVEPFFKFASTTMRTEFQKQIPGPPSTFETENEIIVRFKKPEECILLKDAMNFFDNKMDPKHTAWIMNSIFNFDCFLSFSGICHNDLSSTSIFIYPEAHSIFVVGWFYWKAAGTKLEMLPRRTFNVLPWEAKNSKNASSLIDQECIRLIGRELLGDARGKSYAHGANAKIGAWLNSAATGNAIQNYKSWTTLLESVFGPRKYIKMDLKASMLKQKTRK